MIDWDKYANFSEAEFACQHTGKSGVQEELVARLQAMRTEYGKPIKITSGYRDATHPIETKKSRPGAHAQGTAADILATDAGTRYELMKLAFKHGFVGIAYSRTFVHVDIGHAHMNRPASWTY